MRNQYIAILYPCLIGYFFAGWQLESNSFYDLLCSSMPILSFRLNYGSFGFTKSSLSSWMDFSFPFSMMYTSMASNLHNTQHAFLLLNIFWQQSIHTIKCPQGIHTTSASCSKQTKQVFYAFIFPLLTSTFSYFPFLLLFLSFLEILVFLHQFSDSFSIRYFSNSFFPISET